MAAADPEIIDIPQDAWLEIATAITRGTLDILTGDAVYYHTYRLTGGADPTTVPGDEDFEGAVVYYRPERFALESVIVGAAGIDATEPVDLWMYCEKADGKIRLNRGE